MRYLILLSLLLVGLYTDAQQLTEQHHKRNLRKSALVDSLSKLLPYVTKSEVMLVFSQRKDSTYTYFVTATRVMSEIVFNPPSFDTVLKDVPVLIYVGEEPLVGSDRKYGKALAKRLGGRLKNDMNDKFDEMLISQEPPIYDPILVEITVIDDKVTSITRPKLYEIPYFTSNYMRLLKLRKSR